MKNDTRKGWVDMVRAAAMIFVVYGHAGNEYAAMQNGFDSVFLNISLFINPIKLPMFFALSGYLFSSKNDNPRFFLKREMYSRWFPYLVWGSFMGIIAFGADFVKLGMNTNLLWTLFAENYLIPLVRGELIWFIPCLIVLDIMFFLLLKLSQKKLPILAVLVLICTVAGYMLSKDGVVKPWKTDTALTCLQFMFLGYFYRHFLEEKIKNVNKKTVAVLCSAAYVVLLIVANIVWNGCIVNINMGEYFNPAAFTLLSFVGVMATFSVAKILKPVRAIEFIGKNTLTYFVWHMYVIKAGMVAIKLVPAISSLPMWLVCVGVTALACAAVGVVSLIINRFLWFTVGIKRETDNKPITV